MRGIGLRARRYGDALAEVERLLVEDPTHERLVGMHMIALCGTGRLTEALVAYQRVRALLADEPGVDPSPVLVACTPRCFGEHRSWICERRQCERATRRGGDARTAGTAPCARGVGGVRNRG